MKIQRWLDRRTTEKYCKDVAMYGSGTLINFVRSDWNPLRWLFGKVGLKRIPPNKIYKDFK